MACSLLSLNPPFPSTLSVYALCPPSATLSVHPQIIHFWINYVATLLIHRIVPSHSLFCCFTLVALMAACAQGYKDIVFLLVDLAEIDVNAVDKNGWSALTIAAEKGFYRIVMKLIEKGAVVTVKSSVDWTPLMSACAN